MAVVTLPEQHWIDSVGSIPGLELVVWDLAGPPLRAEQVTVVVPPYLDGSSRIGALVDVPRLELVQLLTAGYESVLPSIPEGVRLANAAGVHDSSTAELAVTLALSSLRGIPGFVVAQGNSQWLPTGIHPALADRSVLILGYGGIGRAVAARLTPFEVRLTAVASRPRAGDELVSAVHGVDELAQLLPQHDVVIVIVPLSDATEHLVDERFLAAMPDGAVLVNVARGRVADTDAILRHAGRLRFALDVTDPEPLPPGHPLWHAPGVLISPHTGGATTAFEPRAVRLLQEQLRAYAAGHPLVNLVR